MKKTSKKEPQVPPVIKAEDQNVIVATADYPFAQWKFEKFNPVQSRVMEYYDKDVNGLIAAMTSSGKTVVAEMFLAQEIRQRGGKGMFLAPMRALAREKVNAWTNKEYHFGDLKTSICTGDYRLTKDRAEELANADLIIMTSEMLNHRSRNFKAEQNNWIKEVGTLIIDESHLLTVKGRGDHLEVGLMKFTDINPKARLVLLSATMPNVEEIADWVSYSLTKRQTFMLRSKYRPVPLTVHYESYDDSNKTYDVLESEKVAKAMEIVEWYSDDKFLIFAHTKNTCKLMQNALKQSGIESLIHNGDLESAERAAVEDQFCNDPKLKVIIATSTLAWGMNMPARRVIILGPHRGLWSMPSSVVEVYDIFQMIGRSGRLGIDKMGDAYILVPESEEAEYRSLYSKPNRIESQLLGKVGHQYKTLAFHLVSEIHHGMETTEDVHRWYKRSLAYFQNKALEEKVVDDTLELLRVKGAIKQEDDKWEARPIGKVSSMFYISPFDVSDLYFNFRNLFSVNKEDDDYSVAMALGDVDSQRLNIVSRIEKDEMSAFMAKVRATGKNYTEPAMKAGFCYFNLLNGFNSQACAGTQKILKFDFDRLSQVLQTLDSMASDGGNIGFYKNLASRITHGVPSYLVNLCQVPNIGKVRAGKLYAKGIKTVEDIAKMDFDEFKSTINLKKDSAEAIMADVRRIVLLS